MSRVMGRGDNQGPLPANLPEGAVTSSESQPRTHAGRELVEDEPRLVTGEHSMLARVLAIEAEAAQDSRPLDVERLAKALSETWGGTPPNWSSDGRFAPERAKRAFAAEAELLAAEYARFAAEKPHD